MNAYEEGQSKNLRHFSYLYNLLCWDYKDAQKNECSQEKA